MTHATNALSGTLWIGLFHYLLRTAMGLTVAWPLGQAAASQFDIIQGFTTLARTSVGWTVGSLVLAGALMAPWANLAITYALAYRCSVSTGFAMTTVRYLDAVRVSLALLLINLVIALPVLALGFGVHSLLDDVADPRIHDMALIAVGCLGVSIMFCTALWHDVARCSLVLQDQPWLASLRTATMQGIHHRIYRPYAAWLVLGLVFALGAVPVGFALEAKPAAVIASQQFLLLGTSLCRIARLQTTLTNVDLYP